MSKCLTLQEVYFRRHRASGHVIVDFGQPDVTSYNRLDEGDVIINGIFMRRQL